jgi:alpha-L-fucosidase
MTMGNSWSYVKNDQYKTSKQIAKNLALIISRGGNYLLNIAPGPNGDWDSLAYIRLAEFGEWMKVNQEAVYETHPISPYEFKTKSGLHFVLTENNKKEVYLFLLNPELNKGEINLDAEEIKSIVSAKNIQFLSKSKSNNIQLNKSINFTLNPNEIGVFKLSK